MILEKIVVGALQVNCYIVACETTREAIVIDPGDNARAILTMLQRHQLSLKRIVATHGHFDHILAARPVHEATGAPFYIHAGDRPALAAMRRTAQSWLGSDPGEPPAVDGELQAGEELRVGTEVALEIRLTPGHSPGGVSLVGHQDKLVFTGDALFAGSIGRTDLPGGDARTLITGIRSQLLTLPADFKVLSGHGPASTIGREMATNPFLEPGAFDSSWT